MKPAIPWSIKGVEPEAREAAKIAARRSGMTLGEWLNTVILDGNDLEPAPEYRPPHRAAFRHQPQHYGPDVHERLDELTAHISRLAHQQSQTAVARVIEPKIDLDPVSDMVRGLVDRLERSEKRSIESMEEFDRRLNRLSDKLLLEIGHSRSETGSSAAGHPAFERALKNIVDHIEQNERRNSESLKAIQSRMNELSTKTRPAPVDAARPNNQLISGLDRRLAELAERIDRMERRGQEGGAIKSIEARVSQLSEQIREQTMAEAASRGRAAATQIDTTSFASRDELQRIQSRVEEIVNRLEDPVLGNPDSAVMQMQEEIASLSRNLADLRIEAASARETRMLRDAIESISAQLGDLTLQGGEADPSIGQMQGEIATLSRRIEELSAGSASSSDVDDVREGLRQIADQIQYLQSSTDDSGASGEIQQEIAAINSMISRIREEAASVDDIHALRAALEHLAARSEQADGGHDYRALEQRIDEITHRLEHARDGSTATHQLSEIEARLNDLDARLSNAPASSLESEAYSLLETQVATLFDRLSAFESAGVAGGNESTNGRLEGAIEALEQGLHAVQASTERNDRRTQETLEAVHETLEKVVNRLARLEDGPAPSPAAADAAEETVQTGLAEAWQPDPPAHDPPGHHAADLRLPPIIGLEEFREPVHASGQTGRHEPTLTEPPHSAADAKATVGPRIGRTDDFIAAARRAAQQAPQVVADEPKTRSSLLSFLSRRPKSGGRRKDARSTKLRTVLLAAAVALLAIGTLSTLPLTQSKRSPSAVEKTDRAANTRLPRQDSTPADSGRQTSDKALSRGRHIDKPINPQWPPSGERQASPQTKTDAGSGATELTKAARPEGRRKGDLTAGVSGDPVVTGSITPVTVDPTAAKEESQITVGSLMFDGQEAAAGQANAAGTPVDRQPGTRPAGAISDGETLPPAEIGPMSLRVAAASGSPAAQFEVAARYTEGRIIAQDFRKAAVWYQRAAAKGLAPAQYRLGTLYEKGLGVPADKAAARIWYERAAEKGNRKAMHNLAVIYADASDGNPNYAKAAMWFRHAADLGLADSQYNYGILAERGLGVRKDAKEAYKWFAIAARNGDKGAEERLALLEQKLAADDLVAVKLQIENWQPKQPVAAANMVEIPSGGWGSSSPDNTAVAAAGAAPASNRTITEVQNLLNSLGYQAGPTDGVLGQRTRDAIREFERDQGLPTTGMVTRPLVEKLNAQPG